MADKENTHGVPGRAGSYWIASTPDTSYPPLADGVSVDVAVLGGGIAGITAAKMLKDGGLTVAVIEADRIIKGVTGHTTAHISSSQGFYFRYMIDEFGMEKARISADSCQASVEKIAETVRRYGIDCDFIRTSEYFYAEREEDGDKLRDEYDASLDLGLPVSYEERAPLPYETYGAIRFVDQAQFHPRKYLLALSRLIPGDGSHIFEGTRALGVLEGEGDGPCTVKTERGDLTVRDVIVATHFPILNRGMLFARMEPLMSYVLGMVVDDEVPQVMFNNSEDLSHYIRTQQTPEGPLVIIGGEDHQTGHADSTIERYRNLQRFARERFSVQSIELSWSSQDTYPFDAVPFIGRFPESDHVFVATGFKGSGMTYGTVAAMILSDLILEGESPWEELYDPARPEIRAGGRGLLSWNAQVAKTYAGERARRAGKIEEIGRGEAGIAEVEGVKLAVFRDDAGQVHAVKPACTHLGCFVSWNDAERSWDCPCHGARFDYDGRVIHAPTVRDMERVI